MNKDKKKDKKKEDWKKRIKNIQMRVSKILKK
jgi:hypothetical protein